MLQATRDEKVEVERRAVMKQEILLVEAGRKSGLLWLWTHVGACWTGPPNVHLPLRS